MTTNQVKTKVLFAYHVDDTELQSIKDGWPEDICLCMIVPGVEDVRYMLFEKSERVQALNNIADEYHMSSREMPVSPRVEGFAKCDMSFTQEQKLQGIIDRHPTLLTDAQDYKLNYQDRKNQSIPPVLNADEQEIVFFDEAFPEEMPKSAPEASEEMSAVDDALINRISIALTEGETFGQEHRVSHMPIEDILETKEPVEDNISTSEDGAAEDEVGTQEASVDADLQQEEVLSGSAANEPDISEVEPVQSTDPHEININEAEDRASHVRVETPEDDALPEFSDILKGKEVTVPYSKEDIAPSTTDAALSGQKIEFTIPDKVKWIAISVVVGLVMLAGLNLYILTELHSVRKSVEARAVTEAEVTAAPKSSSDNIQNIFSIREKIQENAD